LGIRLIIAIIERVLQLVSGRFVAAVREEYGIGEVKITSSLEYEKHACHLFSDMKMLCCDYGVPYTSPRET
jgi:hypothetical protein